MTRQSATIAAEEVGQVYIPVTVSNFVDFARISSGELGEGSARHLELGPILADTGATHLALPPSVVAALGLTPIEEVIVETAQGVAKTTLYGGVLISVDGRRRQIACLALPGDGPPLLGAHAMEELGIELDLSQRTYWLRPDDNRQTYIMV